MRTEEVRGLLSCLVGGGLAVVSGLIYLFFKENLLISPFIVAFLLFIGIGLFTYDSLLDTFLLAFIFAIVEDIFVLWNIKQDNFITSASVKIISTICLYILISYIMYKGFNTKKTELMLAALFGSILITFLVYFGIKILVL